MPFKPKAWLLPTPAKWTIFSEWKTIFFKSSFNTILMTIFIPFSTISMTSFTPIKLKKSINLLRPPSTLLEIPSHSKILRKKLTTSTNKDQNLFLRQNFLMLLNYVIAVASQPRVKFKKGSLCFWKWKSKQTSKKYKLFHWPFWNPWSISGKGRRKILRSLKATSPNTKVSFWTFLLSFLVILINKFWTRNTTKVKK